MNDMDKTKQYYDLVWKYACYGEGDVFEVAKLAKALGRDYMNDIADIKADILQGQGLYERNIATLYRNIKK